MMRNIKVLGIDLPKNVFQLHETVPMENVSYVKYRSGENKQARLIEKFIFGQAFF